MKPYFKFLFLFLIIAAVFSCNKNNNKLQVTDYRPVKFVNNILNGDKTEANYEYSNNRLVRSFGYNWSDSVKIEFVYYDNSVVENYYSKTDSNWVFFHSAEYNVIDNRLISIVYYDSPNATGEISFISEFKYDNNNNLLEYHNYDKKSDTTLENSSFYYFYDTENNLTKTTMYFRVHPDEEMVLYVKRVFSYTNDKLSEELIYNSNYGLPIQLTEKKEYFYNDKLLTGIDHYAYKSGKYELGNKTIFNYDDHGNMINQKVVFANGELFYSNDYTYEAGKTNIKSYYNAYSGSNSTYPVPDAVSKQSGVVLPGFNPFENGMADIVPGLSVNDLLHNNKSSR